MVRLLTVYLRCWCRPRFWMYASVLKIGLQGNVLRVVTNDLIRDHWRDLLEPNAFDRWKQSQVPRRSVYVSLPSLFSRS